MVKRATCNARGCSSPRTMSTHFSKITNNTKSLPVGGKTGERQSMKTEAYKEAQKRYDAKKTKFYGVKLNIETDADIIKALDASDNRQGLIKKAIRSYL